MSMDDLKYLCISTLFRFQTMHTSTDYGRPERKQPSLHSRKFKIFRYNQSIFCLLHWPNFSDIFDLCLHWVYVVCAYMEVFVKATI
jgi:hypothetical protein